MSTLIIAERLSKQFVLHHARMLTVKEQALAWLRGRTDSSHETFTALEDLTFSVDSGESVALVGRNGSGKSTLLKLIAGIHPPTSGRLLVRTGTRIASMIELGVGFHPELTGVENVYLSAAIHGLSRDAIEEIYPQVVEYSELARFIDAPIKTYSSGMVMRLGFAISVHLDPDAFLLDEIFAVGDEAFQHKCVASMRGFQERGKTMFFVSHAAQTVREMCRRTLVLDKGRLVFDGDADDGVRHYQRLIGEEPSLESAAEPGDHTPSDDTPADDTPAVPWHRLVVGGATWDAAGVRHLEWLRAQGLRPRHRVLDLGCGSLRSGVHLLGYLDEGGYVGVDRDGALISAGREIEAPLAGVDASRGRYHTTDVTNLDEVDGTFDVVVAFGLVQDLAYAEVARMFAAAIPKLAPGGRMFVAYFEAPSPLTLERIERPGPSYSYFDQLMRHYDFESLARLVQACGARAERLGEWGDPHGQTMMLVTK